MARTLTIRAASEVHMTSRSTPHHTIRTYRRHNCKRRHRTTSTLAACIWPRAAWITGEGKWASVSYCPRGPSIMLHPTEQAARDALKIIDSSACGGLCNKQHALVLLAPDE